MHLNHSWSLPCTAVLKRPAGCVGKHTSFASFIDWNWPRLSSSSNVSLNHDWKASMSSHSAREQTVLQVSKIYCISFLWKQGQLQLSAFAQYFLLAGSSQPPWLCICWFKVLLSMLVSSEFHIQAFLSTHSICQAQCVHASVKTWILLFSKCRETHTQKKSKKL